MGLISQNSYVDINGDFLRGSYQGHTGKRTEAVIQYAQGMVLFIDEAYTLTAKDGPTDNFGQEAIGVLVDAMEKYRRAGTRSMCWPCPAPVFWPAMRTR